MKIGIFLGEIPPPHFINLLVCNIAEKEHQVFLYGSLKDNNFHYNNSYILLKAKPNNKVNIFLTSILLIIKLIYNERSLASLLLLQIWRHEKKIHSFIKRCCTVIPPFLDDLDVFHIQWAKTLAIYPEFIDQLKCPIILSLRGTHINVSPLADEDLATLYRKYFPKINGFHAVSQSIIKEAMKYGADCNKITFIHPAIDRILLDDKPEKSDAIKSDILHIISVGRCHWIKGYTVALEAMAILKKRGINFYYTIIAGGRDHENIHFQIHDLGLSEYVTFINGLPHDKVIERVSESDLFLLPSVEEGISNAVLEAMALRVPVISTDCGGMAEVIRSGENGFIIPVRDPDSTVQAIQNFQHLDETRKMVIVNNARETIIQNHLMSVQIDRFKSFYYNITQKL